MMAANYSNSMEFDESVIAENAKAGNDAKWSNPLEVALPNAPSMRIHCLYGVGKPTERSYWYQQGPYQRDEIMCDGQNAVCNVENVTLNSPLDFPTGRTGVRALVCQRCGNG